jgi:hypothetical protein
VVGSAEAVANVSDRVSAAQLSFRVARQGICCGGPGCCTGVFMGLQEKAFVA